MTDTSWEITTKSSGTLVATGVITDTLPTFRPGESLTLEFLFDKDNANHVEDYTQLREIVEYATDDNVGTGRGMHGVPYFREQLHPDTGFDSHLVKLTPSSSINGVEPYWAVVVGGTDNTQFVGAGERLETEVVILGPTAELGSRADVEQNLRADR